LVVTALMRSGRPPRPHQCGHHERWRLPCGLSLARAVNSGSETGLMSSADVSPGPPRRPNYDPLAGVLSYLVPGLGQLYQGRVGKGLLFLVCLYGLFFYGMYLGSWKNVYIHLADRNVTSTVLDRIRYAGQFWIGIAAWPALMQHYDIPVPFHKDFQKVPSERELNDLQRDGDKTWDLGWVYTVIAGVLNVLVIYDAVAGPAFGRLAAAAHPAPVPEALREVAA